MPILGNTAGQAGKTSGAATITGVTAGSGSVSVAFTEPTYKGKGSVTYTATSSPGGLTATGTSPITVTGLSNGTSYTFTVTVTTADGVSTISSASSSATPAIPQAGYLVGGFNYSGNVRYSSTQKIAFSNDAVSTIASTLDIARSHAAGFANSGTAGYQAGGVQAPGNHTRRVDKLNFSGDTVSSSITSMSSGATAATSPAAMANSGTAGYIAGGDKTEGGVSYRTSIDKLTFSNDTISVLGATLSQMQTQWAGSANSGTAGYYAGGYNNGSPTGSTIVKLLFSNETRSNLSTTLGVSNMTSNASHANSGTASYWLGGFDSSITGAIQKLPFSTESRSTLGATITARDWPTGFSKSGTAGYTQGGNQRNGSYMSPNTVTISDKLAYSNDTVSSAGSLINAAFLTSGFANSGVL
jgi:hypothetical protein